MVTLEVKKRDVKENPVKLREGGLVPAVFYGRKEKSTPISIPLKGFIKVWKQAGESSIISLAGEGIDDVQVLIQDVDRDPVTGVPIHADFYAIEKDKKLTVKVPIVYSGVSPAVKDLAGILVKVLHELEVEAIPKDLPHEIEVNISKLENFESKIEVKDIIVPTGVKILAKPDEVVALVSEAKEEELEVAPEAVDLSAIEVEKRGKEEEAATVPEEDVKE